MILAVKRKAGKMDRPDECRTISWRNWCQLFLDSGFRRNDNYAPCPDIKCPGYAATLAEAS
jgi:hypothetical protein